MFEKYKLNRSRRKAIKAIDENILKKQQSIEEISKILIDFKKYNYSKHNSFLNLCIFSDIVCIDLIILLEKIRIAKRPQEKKLYARFIAVTAVDYLDNIGVLIGSDCLKELKNNKMDEFLDEFKIVHKKFSMFKTANQVLLREIRNNTAAHKNKDSLFLQEQIDNLDVEKIYNFGIELIEYSKEFVDLSTKIIYYIVDYMQKGKVI